MFEVYIGIKINRQIVVIMQLRKKFITSEAKRTRMISPDK